MTDKNTEAKVNSMKKSGFTTGDFTAAGLSAKEAAARLAEQGPNVFSEKKKKTILQSFILQFKDFMIYILLAAALVSAFLGEFADMGIILVIVLFNAFIGTLQEQKAENALEALKKLASPMALVRRDGQPVEIPASDIVCGDIVILEAGRVVPADMRLLSSVNLRIEESALTGESVPSDKDAEFEAKGDVPLGDRLNMAYMSTSVAYGRGEGLVTATGMNTEIGKIADMINKTKDEMTPLQKRLGDLGKLLGIITVILCVALFFIAYIQQREMGAMLITAISLAVAAIPEGLPAVVTIVLALGVQRMVKVNTIVRKLPAVETLGAVSIVCSDKTGTLTQNRMTAVALYVPGQSFDNAYDLDDEKLKKSQHLIGGFILASDAEVNGDNRIGDPTELAFVDLGIRYGMERADLQAALPRINERAFDSDRKMMTTVHRCADGELISYTKGAMDRILNRVDSILINGEEKPITDDEMAEIEAAASNMTAKALRVLALAQKKGDADATEENMTFVGLLGMIDPPREEAKDAVASFKEAHVRTVMITGDHKDTAFAIARDLGIADSIDQCMSGDEIDMLTPDELKARVMDMRVFARVSPENKVSIVKAYKANGQIVSMTGDGVNDAPSLKAADIGVAMGITGTDVSKGAADMILTDDNFATIEKAIAEGRNIYGNIRRSVLFLLSSNFGEIITMFFAICAGMAAPLRAIHILWVNLITDSLPALALGVNPGNPDVMKEKPRNQKESIFARGGYAFTISMGAVIAASSLFAFTIAPGGIKSAQTYAFTVLAMAQLFNAVGMRDMNTSVFKIKHLENKMMLVAVVTGVLLQVAVTEIPFLVGVFETVELGIGEWLKLILIASSPMWMHEIIVLVKFLNRKKDCGQKRINTLK